MEKRDPKTYAIIGAAMEVHRELGCGFLEPVYQEALALEFRNKEITFKREVELPISYKVQLLSTTYRVDFVCFGSIVVELKAMTKMGRGEEAQIINYLKAAGIEAGILLNFGSASLEYRRFVQSKGRCQ